MKLYEDNMESFKKLYNDAAADVSLIERFLLENHANPELDTMFLTSEHQYMYLSSSTVKELAGQLFSSLFPIQDKSKGAREVCQETENL